MNFFFFLIRCLSNVGVFLLLLTFIAYWYSLFKFNYWRKKGIKGPPALPFIGNIFNPFRATPLLQIDYFKNYGYFFGLYQGRKPLLSISDPTIIKRILVEDFNVFRNRISRPDRHRILSQNLVSARDEKWKRIRSILSPMFTTSKLKKMEGFMTQCVDSMIEALGNIADTNQSFLVHGVMGNFTMDVIAKCAFATETNAHRETDNQFVKNAKQILSFNMFKSFLLFLIPPFLQQYFLKLKIPYFYMKEMDFFLDMAYHLLRKRKNSKSNYEDMLQLMINAEHGKEKKFETDDDAHQMNINKEDIEQESKFFSDIIGSKYLNEEEIVAQSIVFFLAGYETTASTLTLCLYELARHPEIQEKLYEELKTIMNDGKPLDYNNLMKLPLLDAVLSETLRLHPPALILSREAGKHYYIPEYNYTMEPGEGIIIPIYAIHHNPKYYPNPKQFNPERFLPGNRNSIIPYTYLPFGGGPRRCIGMRFALSEAKLGLAQIIKNFIIYNTNPENNNIEIKNSLFLLKTAPIHVEIKRREKVSNN